MKEILKNDPFIVRTAMAYNMKADDVYNCYLKAKNLKEFYDSLIDDIFNRKNE